MKENALANNVQANSIDKFYSVASPYKIEDQSYSNVSCYLYVFCAILFALWTFDLLWDRWNQIINPVSSNGFETELFHQLLYPAITLCNILPGQKIKPKKCRTISEKSLDCEFIESKHFYKSTNLKSTPHKKYNYCITYNYNPESAFSSNKKSLDDILFYSITLESDQQFESIINGAIVSLHSQGSKANISNGIIISSGSMMMLRLKKVVHEFLNMTSIETFQAQTSDLTTLNFESNWGMRNETLVVALSYEDLNVNIIRELPPFTFMSFLSETGGIIGLLLGSSLVNVLIGLIQWIWGIHKSELDFISIHKKNEASILEISGESNQQNDEMRICIGI